MEISAKETGMCLKYFAMWHVAYMELNNDLYTCINTYRYNDIFEKF